MNYDFLTRLQNGESVEAIADELTKSLNEANRQHIQEKEAKKQKEIEQAQYKRELAEDLVDVLYELFDAYGLDLGADQEEDANEVQEVIDLMDELVPILKPFLEIKKAMNKPEEKKSAASGDPIGDFLKLFVDK